MSKLCSRTAPRCPGVFFALSYAVQGPIGLVLVLLAM